MGKILILSDIHGNRPALEAVLERAGDCDSVWCCGDIVGYGPYPLECVHRIRELNAIVVAGNHDVAALGLIETKTFNRAARSAVEWTATQLDTESVDYLMSLPYQIKGFQPGSAVGVTEESSAPDFRLVHGSPHEPLSEYLVTTEKAWYAFKTTEEKVCICGHTHFPWIYRQACGNQDVGEMHPLNKDEFLVEDGYRYIINVGSVGQPRDGNPSACYFTYDTGHNLFMCHRVKYPVEKTQRAMRSAGLAESLILRLTEGY